MAKSKLPPIEVLKDLYSVQRLTLEQIGERYGVTAQRVQQVFAKANIPRNPRPRARVDREALESLYKLEKLPLEEIAAKLGMSTSAVGVALGRYGLKRRGIADRFPEPLTKKQIEAIYVKQGKTQKEAAAELGMSVEPFLALLRKFGIMHRHTRHPGYAIPEAELRRLYVEDRKTAAEIAKIFGCSRSTIDDRLDRLGIRRKRKA